MTALSMLRLGAESRPESCEGRASELCAHSVATGGRLDAHNAAPLLFESSQHLAWVHDIELTVRRREDVHLLCVAVEQPDERLPHIVPARHSLDAHSRLPLVDKQRTLQNGKPPLPPMPLDAASRVHSPAEVDLSEEAAGPRLDAHSRRRLNAKLPGCEAQLA